MQIKRPHKKSRSGCMTCRKRRVKCDEKRPYCSICIQRDEECKYPQSAPSRGTHANALSTAGPSSAHMLQLQHDPILNIPALKWQASFSNTCSRVYDSSHRATRFRELELMHHWTMTTCNSFTSTARKLLQTWVPQSAMQQDHLVESLLALSALQIACDKERTTGNPWNLYAGAALQYQNRAAAALRVALHGLAETNCDAILVSAIFIMVCSMVSATLNTDCDNGRTTAEMIRPMVETMKGVASVLQLSWSWIMRGPLLQLPQKDPARSQGIPTNLLLQDLRQLVKETKSDGMREVFNNSIASLESAVYKFDVLPWLLVMKPEFLDQLQEDDDLAVAITLQWAVQLVRLSDMWWSTYFGRRLVEKLSLLLEGRGDEWHRVATWSRQQVVLYA
jgi:hypothetical protein